MSPHSSHVESHTLLPPDIERDYQDAFISPRPRWSRTLIASLALNVVLIVYFVVSHPTVRSKLPGTVLGVEPQTIEWRGAKPVYSPAQDVVTHVIKVSGGFTTRDEYSGPPSDKVDAAWNAAYAPYLFDGVPREQAALLPNQTERVAGNGPPRYFVGLDVFHQLHCLNRVRKALYPERYKPKNDTVDHSHDSPLPPSAPGDPPFDHVDHCLNSVRESLMCNADISPVVYEWDDEHQMNYSRLNIPHTCKDLGPIQEWAKKWAPKQHAQWDDHVPDDWTWTPPLPPK